MVRSLSLDYFHLPAGRKYHVYRIGGSETSQEPHTHNYYQLCYVDCGEILHVQGDAPVRLLYGDAFLVPPGFVHRIVFPDDGALLYSLSFSESLFDEGFVRSNAYRFMTALKLDALNEKRIDVRMKVTLDEARRGMMKGLLEALLREGENNPEPALAAAPSLIASILCVLAQAYAADDGRRESLDNAARYGKSMEDCLLYIDNHFTEPLTAGSLSHRFALSRSTFGLLFPRRTGMTLRRYIAEKRIAYAAQLMKNAALSANEIAAMAGYAEFSTFYRNFLKITGVSPSEYRAHLGSRA